MTKNVSANLRYESSEKGKTTRKTYQSTDASKEVHLRYLASPKGKATREGYQSRYKTSAKGKEVEIRRYNRRERLMRVALCTLTSDEWEKIKEDYDQRCAYCHQKKPLTRDHKIPVSRGGDHTKENIVPACKSCNSRKGTRAEQEFMLCTTLNETEEGR